VVRLGRPATPVTVVVVVVALALAGCGNGGDGAVTARQDEVAERGVEVMPFDLDATTHHFEPTADGLVEDVWADDPTDGEQVELVRSHLRTERDRFARGDYGDPAAIHGEDMPGLAELAAGADEIEVVYEQVDGGARLVFTSSNPVLVDALHRWGEAQTSDHGEHAE
jgi:hypothetical protein